MAFQRSFQGPGILGPGMMKPDPGGMGQFGGDFVGGGGLGGPQMVPAGEAGGGMGQPPPGFAFSPIGATGSQQIAPDMSGGGMQAGGFGGGLGFNGLGKPQENKYDRFAAAMMQARGRRGMGGRPMAKPMLGGMGGPMTRPQAPRGSMQQSPPIVPQPMTNTMQKPGRLTQPGAPVFTAPAGVGEY